ncbi:hypothetical protein AXX17_AT2G08570 [Arabidopsis thaliana]|uniref:Transmembrane protein n=1 Tax=Arabidopsis thaliana TaxID=3702 RepID=A0A178VUQ1_ARATH|nr:hypothetical protein AXX17_AT2G08570 [Arabidopsis thaliana]
MRAYRLAAPHSFSGVSQLSSVIDGFQSGDGRLLIGFFAVCFFIFTVFVSGAISLMACFVGSAASSLS